MFQTILSISAFFISTVYSLYLFYKRERYISSFVIFTAIMSVCALELFDLLAILEPEKVLFWKKFSLFAEGCLPLSWFLFSLISCRQYELQSISIKQRLLIVLSCCFPIVALAIPVNSFFYSLDFNSERILFLGNTGFIFYISVLVYLVVALINLEVTLANASLGSRWKIKFEILGAGSFLAFLIIYYSQGLLYRSINMNLVPVRSFALILAVAMMAYSRFFRGNGVKVSISPQVAYKSVVLLFVGLYLVGLGLMGEGMKYFGDSFQRSIIIAFALLVGTGLIIVLLSETVKRKVRVYLHKNFYQNKYDYRTQWLQFTDRLSSSKSGDELLQSILSGYADTFGMGCGSLFLYDGELGAFHAAASLEMEPESAEFKRNDALISLMAGKKWVVNVRERINELEAQPLEFFTRNDISFVIPLFFYDVVDGFIVLGKPVNRDEVYNYEDYDLMKTLARQASSAILNLRLSEQLAQAREMEALGKISAFVIHDLKNLVYTISLVVDNAKDYLSDPEFQQDMIESLGNTVAKMKTLISRLKNLPEKHLLKRESSDLLELVLDTTKLIVGADFSVVGSTVIAPVDRDELQKVALNLFLNAVEANDGRGVVTVEVGEKDQAFIRVIDKGCGISPDFMREYLFTPFKTTKKKGLGIGLYQCKQIVEAHSGRIEVSSEVGRGTVFTVWLPKGCVG